MIDWCNYTSDILSESSLFPRELPRGVFLICGDRVWAGIPFKIERRPCSLGQLTTLTPKTQILDWKREKQLAHKKRSYSQFEPNCDFQIYYWGTSKTVATSVFLP